MKEEFKLGIAVLLGIVMGMIIFYNAYITQQEDMLNEELVLKRVHDYLYFTDDAPNIWKSYMNENLTLVQVRGFYTVTPMAQALVLNELQTWCGLR